MVSLVRPTLPTGSSMAKRPARSVISRCWMKVSRKRSGRSSPSHWRSPAGLLQWLGDERPDLLRLTFIQHLLITDRAGRFAMLLPVGRVGLTRLTIQVCPLAGDAVGTAGTAIDDCDADTVRAVTIEDTPDGVLVGPVPAAADQYAVAAHAATSRSSPPHCGQRAGLSRDASSS